MTGPGDLLRFWLLRKLERLLPPDALYRTLLPLASVLAASHTLGRPSQPPVRWPGGFGARQPVPPAKLRRRNYYLNRTIELFPDRLSAPEWNRRCRINGFEQVQDARRQGRPVLLAFCHVGPYVLLRFWLRAAGLPAATLVRGNPAKRPKVRRLTDQLSPFAGIPTVFYHGDLAHAVRFLRTGNPLLVAVDHDAGKQVAVPVRDGWSFRMATGAIRLAASHNAELIPCAILDEGGWHFRIELGRPVPRELLSGQPTWCAAGKHLLDQLLPHLQSHPEPPPEFLGRLRQDAGTLNPH